MDPGNASSKVGRPTTARARNDALIAWYWWVLGPGHPRSASYLIGSCSSADLVPRAPRGLRIKTLALRRASALVRPNRKTQSNAACFFVFLFSFGAAHGSSRSCSTSSSSNRSAMSSCRVCGRERSRVFTGAVPGVQAAKQTHKVKEEMFFFHVWASYGESCSSDSVTCW